MIFSYEIDLILTISCDLKSIKSLGADRLQLINCYSIFLPGEIKWNSCDQQVVLTIEFKS